MEKVPIPVPFPPPAAVDDVDSTLGKDDVNTRLHWFARNARAYHQSQSCSLISNNTSSRTSLSTMAPP